MVGFNTEIEKCHKCYSHDVIFNELALYNHQRCDKLLILIRVWVECII